MVTDKKGSLTTVDALRAGDTITLRGAVQNARCTVEAVEEINESTQKF